MTKSTIRSNLTQFSPDISVVQSNNLSYVLGETNSYSCHGAPGVSNTAGAALWALDYTLTASQLGIERLYFHEGIGYKYNFVRYPDSLVWARSLISTLPILFVCMHSILDLGSTRHPKQVYPGRIHPLQAPRTAHPKRILRRCYHRRSYRPIRKHQGRRAHRQ